MGQRSRCDVTPETISYIMSNVAADRSILVEFCTELTRSRSSVKGQGHSVKTSFNDFNLHIIALL